MSVCIIANDVDIFAGGNRVFFQLIFRNSRLLPVLFIIAVSLRIFYKIIFFSVNSNSFVFTYLTGFTFTLHTGSGKIKPL